MKTLNLIISILLIAGLQKSFSQTATNDSIYFITTHDGSIISGTLNEKNEKEIKITSKSFGTVSIPLDSIKEMNVQSVTAHNGDGKYWFKNPNSTRYFVSPSAIPLEKGEGYFQNTYLFVCSFNYGVSKNISIGAGTDVLRPFIKDGGGPSALLNLKAGFKVTNNFYVGGTTMFIRAPFYNEENESDWSNYLLEDVTLTFGNSDINCTLGAAYGLKNGNWQSRPTFTLSGMARVTPRFCFVSENWLVPVSDKTYDPYGVEETNINNELVFSYGMRFMSQKIAVDFGFINQKDIAKEIFIGIPYVDFVVKF